MYQIWRLTRAGTSKLHATTANPTVAEYAVERLNNDLYPRYFYFIIPKGDPEWLKTRPQIRPHPKPST